MHISPYNTFEKTKTNIEQVTNKQQLKQPTTSYLVLKYIKFIN